MAYGVLRNLWRLRIQKRDEVFPSTSEDLDLFFSRASKNYGLQLYQHGAGDSTPVAMALNNRGDEFGLVLLNDSTALFSQSKRPGSPTNLQLYSLPIPPPPPPSRYGRTWPLKLWKTASRWRH